MTYRVEFRPAAARELRKLDRSARDRIAKVVALLAEEPRPPAAKMLTGDRGAAALAGAHWRLPGHLQH